MCPDPMWHYGLFHGAPRAFCMASQHITTMSSHRFLTVPTRMKTTSESIPAATAVTWRFDDATVRQRRHAMDMGHGSRGNGVLGLRKRCALKARRVKGVMASYGTIHILYIYLLFFIYLFIHLLIYKYL